VQRDVISAPLSFRPSSSSASGCILENWFPSASQVLTPSRGRIYREAALERMAGNAPARKERPTGLIGQIKWLAIAFIALLVFVFLAFFASRFQGTKLEAKLGDKSISIRTTGYQVPVEEIEALDTRESFVSSEQGFAFKNWKRRT
jgi:hypothetical protein